MRTYAICIALATVTSAASVSRADDDPWFGKDKTAHFGASALIAAAGYGVGVAAFDTRIDGLVIGSSSALTIGLGKEVYDAVGYGTVSARDFTWNAIGAATGLLLALTVDWLVRGNIPCFGASCLSNKTPPALRKASVGPRNQTTFALLIPTQSAAFSQHIVKSNSRRLQPNAKRKPQAVKWPILLCPVQPLPITTRASLLRSGTLAP